MGKYEREAEAYFAKFWVTDPLVFVFYTDEASARLVALRLNLHFGGAKHFLASFETKECRYTSTKEEVWMVKCADGVC